MDVNPNPARSTFAGDLYTVVNYFPESQTCDLQPASANQRGLLSSVPIAAPFSGAWETQSHHQPAIADPNNTSGFGNAPRGARWGITFPVEPGDMAVVQYIGGSMSDPIITSFVSWRTGYGVPWTANQILSQQNDYTEQLPSDDDLLPGRFDLLLPSGAWLRSTQAGSWAIATPPADRSKNFISLHADGNIRIKARSGEHYSFHLEADPAKETARIVVGKLEDGSYIEFKDGDITIRAKKRIRFLGEEVRGDVRPQGGSSAMDVLTSTPAAAIADSDLPGIAMKAAGQTMLQAVSGIMPVPPGVVALTTRPIPSPAVKILDKKSLKGMAIASLISNPAIDGALRGRLGDILSNPQSLVQSALELLRGGLPNENAIGDALTQLLGANVLSGNIGEILSGVNLTALPMIQELGIPSWVGEGIQAIASGGDIGAIALDILDDLPSITDNELLDKVCRFVGNAALRGHDALSARSLLQEALGELEDSSLLERVNEVILPLIDELPLLTPRAGGEQDWMETAFQRLGRHILRGNNLLGGAIALFDGAQLEGLPDEVRSVVDKIQAFAANPHQLADDLPEGIQAQMGAIASIPVEIRDAMSRLPQDLMERLPQVASGSLGAIAANAPSAEDAPCGVFEEVGELLTSIVAAWTDEELELGAILQSAPQQIRELIQDLPQELLSGLRSLGGEQLGAVLQNPQAILGGLNTGMIRDCFGGLTSRTAGAFDMRVTQRATFTVLPSGATPLPNFARDEYHVDTARTEIERTSGYARLNVPSEWQRQSDRPTQ